MIAKKTRPPRRPDGPSAQRVLPRLVSYGGDAPRPTRKEEEAYSRGRGRAALPALYVCRTSNVEYANTYEVPASGRAENGEGPAGGGEATAACGIWNLLCTACVRTGEEGGVAPGGRRGGGAINGRASARRTLGGGADSTLGRARLIIAEGARAGRGRRTADRGRLRWPWRGVRARKGAIRRAWRGRGATARCVSPWAEGTGGEPHPIRKDACGAIARQTP